MGKTTQKICWQCLSFNVSYSYSNIMNMEINAGKVIFPAPVRFEFVINDVTMVSVMGTVRFIHF